MAELEAVVRRLVLWSLSVLFLVATAQPAEAVARRVFATSVAGTGNLSTWPVGSGTGLARGDSICQTLAFNAELPNPGLYRAWLSTSTTDAFCHLFGYTGKRSDACGGQLEAGEDLGPFVLANGVSNWSGTLRGIVQENHLLLPALFDENVDRTGALFESAVWTGTAFNGVHSGSSCSNFTSASASADGTWGTAVATTQLWTRYNDSGDCASPRRLLCVEAGVGDPAPEPYWLPGRIVFVTSAVGTGDLLSWPEAAGASGPGIAAGDRICRTLAEEAHLPAPQSFVAWLSDGSTDAVNRIPATGTYRRLDGFSVAGSRADLVDGDNDGPINQNENGDRNMVAVNVWTGTDSAGLGATSNCSGWTTDTVSGLSGFLSVGHSGEWTDIFNMDCAFEQHLYCFSTALTIFWDGFELTGDDSRWSSVTP